MESDLRRLRRIRRRAALGLCAVPAPDEGQGGIGGQVRPAERARREIEQLTADCTQRRLTTIAATLPTLLKEAAAPDLSHSAFLSTVLRTEVATKQETHHTMRFVANGANARLLGPPGVGKTHLSVALGMEACRLGLRVVFTTAAALITTLGKALHENRLVLLG